MIPISKEVAEFIRSKSPDTPIPMTCRDKPKGKRKKRSVEDTNVIKKLIKEYEDNYVKIIYDSNCPEKYKK